ncbi:acyltransferase [Anabaena sp. PCC 7108]|uniref:acyltransferase family protein n=1 Tax=Anabaena sp. PCC 7108 TaxID=163908 RepID=UPI00034A40FF|nr:acyltransferase [Anabaena sp. PCC 7108]
MTTQNQTQKNRFHWIDRTKGLAILGIILFHFFQNYPERNQIITILDRNAARVGYAAVDIFFLMAGFNTSYALVSRSIKAGSDELSVKWKSWLVSRLIRLYPSYWLAVTSTCLLYYFFGRFKITSTPNFILSVLGLAGVHTQAINPGFWFFTVIIQAYLITPLIFIICKNHRQEILWLGIIVATLTKIVAFYFLSENNIPTYLFFLQNNFLGSYIFQFFLGLYWGYIYAEHHGFRKIDFLIATIVFSLGLILYGFFLLRHINIIYMLGFDMLFTPFFFLGIKAILLKLEKIVSFQWILSSLSILGIYSYQIYLIHQPLYFVLLPKLQKIIHLNSYLTIFVSLFIALGLLTIYVLIFTKLEKIVIEKLASVYK